MVCVRGGVHLRRACGAAPSSPPDVERRQFVSRAKTSRLRSALMALSVAASSAITAAMLAPIVEHRSHILRSSSAPRSSKKGAGRPRPKPSAARTSQGVARCGRMSNGIFVIGWNSLCYGLSHKLDHCNPPSAAHPKTQWKSNSARCSESSQLEALSRDDFLRSPHLQTIADRLA